MKKIFKFLGKLLAILGAAYAALFAVFFFDLDGKFLYFVWTPLMKKKFDSMKKPDVTQTPYYANVDKA